MVSKAFSVLALLCLSATCLNAQFLAAFQTKPVALNSTRVGEAQATLPAGITVVTDGNGGLDEGDVLTTTWATADGIGGTGKTIVKINKKGEASNWAVITEPVPGCGSSIGLTPAICSLPGGYVAAGSIPLMSDGNYSRSEPGCILILNSTGQVVDRIFGSQINGPWRMACSSQGSDKMYMFVSTGLKEAYTQDSTDDLYSNSDSFKWADWNTDMMDKSGSVVKINLKVKDNGIPKVRGIGFIAKNQFYSNVDDKFLGPGGLVVLDSNLFFVDPFSNSLWVSYGAAAAPDVFEEPTLVCTSKKDGSKSCPGLNVPVDVTRGPSGQLLVANYGNSTIVEIANGAQEAEQRAVKFVDIAGADNGWGQIMGIDTYNSKNWTLLAGFEASTIFALQTPGTDKTQSFAGRKLM